MANSILGGTIAKSRSRTIRVNIESSSTVKLRDATYIKVNVMLTLARSVGAVAARKSY